jgi:hypothetical protein
MIPVPIEWLLSVLVSFGGIIATLAVVIYRSLVGRLASQDKIIEDMRREVERLSKGCGIAGCVWRSNPL